MNKNWWWILGIIAIVITVLAIFIIMQSKYKGEAIYSPPSFDQDCPGRYSFNICQGYLNICDDLVDACQSYDCCFFCLPCILEHTAVCEQATDACNIASQCWSCLAQQNP